jgi:hypothetical protein
MAEKTCKNCGEEMHEGIFSHNYSHICNVCKVEGCDSCGIVPRCDYCEKGFCEKHIEPKDHKCPEYDFDEDEDEKSKEVDEEAETEDSNTEEKETKGKKKKKSEEEDEDTNDGSFIPQFKLPKFTI